MTGEMSKEEVTSDAYPIHFALAREIGGTVEPFDQYQGPYVAHPEGGRIFMATDDGFDAYWFDESRRRFSEFFPATGDESLFPLALARYSEMVTNGGRTEAPTPEPQTYHVLIVEHKFGQTVSIHQSEDNARAALAKWCREYWKQEMPPRRKMPADDRDVISGYFDHMGDRGESYAIHSDVKIED